MLESFELKPILNENFPVINERRPPLEPPSRSELMIRSRIIAATKIHYTPNETQMRLSFHFIGFASNSNIEAGGFH